MVIGREADGVSEEVLAAADAHIFLPMYEKQSYSPRHAVISISESYLCAALRFGFTESFNVSVACGLLLQRLFDICPQARGQMDEK